MTDQIGLLDTEAVTRAVWAHFAAQSWWGLTELGAPPAETPGAKSRRCDLLLMRTPKRLDLGPLERLVVEVKVSRADFLRDVANPDKQSQWRTFAHRFAYAAPDGLIHKHEIPAGAGLLVVADVASWTGRTTRTVKWASMPAYTDTDPEIPHWLFATIAAKASWGEARVKGWTMAPTDRDNDVQALRHERDAALTELARVKDHAVRLSEERTAWRRLAGLVTDVPCEHCGQNIIPARLTRFMTHKWKHRDRGAGLACREAQMLAHPERLAALEPRPSEEWLPEVTA